MNSTYLKERAVQVCRRQLQQELQTPYPSWRGFVLRKRVMLFVTEQTRLPVLPFNSVRWSMNDTTCTHIYQNCYWVVVGVFCVCFCFLFLDKSIYCAHSTIPLEKSTHTKIFQDQTKIGSNVRLTSNRSDKSRGSIFTPTGKFRAEADDRPQPGSGDEARMFNFPHQGPISCDNSATWIARDIWRPQFRSATAVSVEVSENRTGGGWVDVQTWTFCSWWMIKVWAETLLFFLHIHYRC